MKRIAVSASACTAILLLAGIVFALYAGRLSPHPAAAAGAVAPERPVNVSPAPGATDVALRPVLQSTAFSDPDGASHGASQWQISAESGDYMSPLLDTGLDAVDLTSFTVDPGTLYHYTVFYWRVRYQDSQGAWSDWSAETSFRTIFSPVATIISAGSPEGVAVDGAGNIYVAGSHRVDKINPSGGVTVLAGTGAAGFSGDGGPATVARLNGPRDVAIDAAGNVYIADALNHRVRKVDTLGNIQTIAGTGVAAYRGDYGPAVVSELNGPSGVAVDTGYNVYISDTANHRVRRVDSRGVIVTLAAGLESPRGLALDDQGNVYVAVAGAHRVDVISRDGSVRTVAGSGFAGFGGDGGPAVYARLMVPCDVVLEESGVMYVADARNYRIRRVDVTGVITTVAWTGGEVHGVAVDNAGNVYIADTENHRILRVHEAGMLANFPPGQPANMAPHDGAAGLGMMPCLQSTPYVDLDMEDTHAASQWQVASAAGDYSLPAFDSGTDVMNLTSIVVPYGLLDGATTYYWRARHQDNEGAWSEWSTETSFGRLDRPPNQPSNLFPADGSSGTSLMPTLESSAFADLDCPPAPASADAHTASQWQVSAEAGDYSSPLYDSGPDSSNLTSVVLPAGIVDQGRTYYWRVRHRDNYGAWSSWSGETSYVIVEAAGAVLVSPAWLKVVAGTVVVLMLVPLFRQLAAKLRL